MKTVKYFSMNVILFKINIYYYINSVGFMQVCSHDKPPRPIKNILLYFCLDLGLFSIKSVTC